MKSGAPKAFGAQLKSLREAAGFTQEELATIAGLSVRARSVRERLGPDRWAAAYAAGRTMSIDLLLKDIDGVLSSARGN